MTNFPTGVGGRATLVDGTRRSRPVNRRGLQPLLFLLSCEEKVGTQLMVATRRSAAGRRTPGISEPYGSGKARIVTRRTSVQRYPLLQTVRSVELAAANGLSEHYCSLIRLGKRIPHGRHWEVMRAVGLTTS